MELHSIPKKSIQKKQESILFHPESLKHQVIIGGKLVGEKYLKNSREVKNFSVWLV